MPHVRTERLQKNMTMTPRERIMTVLDGGIPDRVPTFEMYVDPGVYTPVSGCTSYEDFADWADLDAVADLSTVAPPQINWVDADKRIARDKWGSTRQYTEDFIPFFLPPGPVADEQTLATYTPPSPEDHIILSSVKKLSDRFKGTRAIVAVGEAVFAPMQYMRGDLADLLIDFRENSNYVRKLAGICEEYHIELYRRVIRDAGAEIICLGDDYAGKNGPFFAPSDFEQFIAPSLTRIITEIKNAGAYVIKHTDGTLWPILDQLVACGMHALGPLEAVPGFEFDKIHQHTGHAVTLMGNIDIDLLSRGTPEQVTAAVKACLAAGATNGRCILSSGNTICVSVRPDNYAAMLEAIRTYGQYPLDVTG